MLKFEGGVRLGTLLIAVAGLLVAPFAYADDMDDVMDIVQQYADLEGDLEAQARLIRDDRVMITNVRQTDQAMNMAVQIAAAKANDAANGGPTQVFTSIESPVIRIYGDVAVASFVRLFTVIPNGQPPNNTPPLWFTLVLVKERGNWGIAHSHISPAGGN